MISRALHASALCPGVERDAIIGSSTLQPARSAPKGELRRVGSLLPRHAVNR